MGKNRSFKDDPALAQELDLIPKNERSTVIRMALRQYFGITPKKGVVNGDNKDPARPAQSRKRL